MATIHVPIVHGVTSKGLVLHTDVVLSAAELQATISAAVGVAASGRSGRIVGLQSRSEHVICPFSLLSAYPGWFLTPLARQLGRQGWGLLFESRNGASSGPAAQSRVPELVAASLAGLPPAAAATSSEEAGGGGAAAGGAGGGGAGGIL